MADTDFDVPDFDVLIVGAGISGIGAACHLHRSLPGTSYAIVEARADLGGTWDLFRYPGIRSDSDIFTFGYDFRPWETDEAIASGPAIKAYVAQTARAYGVDRHIRFQHRVVAAHWCSARQHWAVHVERSDTGAQSVLRARWLFTAAGYYRYDEGFTPPFEGRERFRGRIVHPQHWPEDLDYRGQRVLVIGSGATAVTLVPAMAGEAAHVTMLQRTPSYVMPVPAEDPVARRLRPLFGNRIAHAAARSVNIGKQRWFHAFCQRFPNAARKLIRAVNRRLLPKGYPVDVHFNPPYAPWDQRLCAVPGGDLFRAIREGRASVVTDQITSFTEAGVQLKSGEHVEADIIVTATGLNLQPFGGIPLKVDGEPVNLPDTVAFKGMLLSGVPNLAFAIGYTSSSWTLKVGLLCEHFCRLLAYMDRHGFGVCTPIADPTMQTRPLLDFGAGYVRRSLAQLPRQGTRFPWLMSWNYASDAKLFRIGRVDDPQLRFTPRAASSPAHAQGMAQPDEHGDCFATLPDGMRLCYRVHGPASGEPILLIAGLGLQLTSWPGCFVQALVAAGHQVITPDNRDVGRSSSIDARPPNKLQQLLARPPAHNYSLDDMADDMIRLLGHLRIRRAHLVGMSMGGMIAQVMASRHPDRALSLVSIFSSPGARNVGQPARSTLMHLASATPPRTREQAAQRFVAIMRHVGNPTVPGIEAVWSDYAQNAWERGGQRPNETGVARQIGAIHKSGDRTAQLRRVQAPTLVLHGDIDLMVDPSGGRATAQAIPGARMLTIEGMRHQIDDMCSTQLGAHILAHIEGVGARRREATPADATAGSP